MKKLILTIFAVMLWASVGWGLKIVGEFGFSDNVLRIGGSHGFGFAPPGNKDFGFDVINTQTIAGVFRTVADQTITVEWGDGTSNTYSGITDQAYSKDYGSAGNRKVKIKNSKSLTRFTMTTTGANISFNLSSLPASMTYFICYGSNTVTGNLSSLPASMTYFNCQGFNTVTGNLSSLPASLICLVCTGSNTISDYSGKTWNNNVTYVRSIPAAGSGLDSAEVDQLLIDLAAATWAGTGRVLNIGSPNARRTAASDTALNTLRTTRAVTVTVQDPL